MMCLAQATYQVSVSSTPPKPTASALSAVRNCDQPVLERARFRCAPAKALLCSATLIRPKVQN